MFKHVSPSIFLIINSAIKVTLRTMVYSFGIVLLSLLSDIGYSGAVVQRNLNKSLLFCDTLFGTKCCRVLTVAAITL